MIGYTEGRSTSGDTGSIEVDEAIAIGQDEFWISPERVPVSGFASEAIPALNRLAGVVYGDVEGVFTRVLGREGAIREGSALIGATISVHWVVQILVGCNLGMCCWVAGGHIDTGGKEIVGRNGA